MGGCRCSFRECQNNTSNTMKMVHFFHYPHKDLERVEKWCNFSNNKSFMSLPPEKLRNKVVCEQHFRRECFMNVYRESLTKTAVPTLMTTHFGGIVDLQKYNWPKLNASVTAEMLFNWGVVIEKPEKTCKDEVVVLHNNLLSKQTPVDPLGKEMTLSIDSIESLDTVVVRPHEVVDENLLEEMTPSQKPPTRLTRVPKPKFINHKVTVIDPATMAPTTQPAKRAKIDIKPISGQTSKTHGKPQSKNSIDEISSTGNHERNHDTLSQTTNTLLGELAEIKEVIKQQIDSYAGFKSLMTESVSSMETSTGTITTQLENSKRQLMGTQNQLIESQKLLAKTQKQLTELLQQQNAQQNVTMAQLERLSQLPQSTLNSSDSDAGKLEKNSMKKVQLFNGIKRYLNPAVVALLRMEMFGSAERPYKSDEKNFAAELLNLGDETYDYFTDEWRFRLPPKQMVKTWSDESNEDEDV